MKRLIQLLILLLFISGFAIRQKNKLLSTIKVGKHSYRIYQLTKFEHEKNRPVDYFEVRGQNNEVQCSGYKLDRKNDSIYISGRYSFNEKFLEFREYYFNARYDSVIKRFYPNKNGKLILLRFIEYKAGVEKITKY